MPTDQPEDLLPPALRETLKRVWNEVVLERITPTLLDLLSKQFEEHEQHVTAHDKVLAERNAAYSTIDAMKQEMERLRAENETLRKDMAGTAVRLYERTIKVLDDAGVPKSDIVPDRVLWLVHERDDLQQKIADRNCQIDRYMKIADEARDERDRANDHAKGLGEMNLSLSNELMGVKTTRDALYAARNELSKKVEELKIDLENMTQTKNALGMVVDITRDLIGCGFGQDVREVLKCIRSYVSAEEGEPLHRAVLRTVSQTKPEIKLSDETLAEVDRWRWATNLDRSEALDAIIYEHREVFAQLVKLGARAGETLKRRPT